MKKLLLIGVLILATGCNGGDDVAYTPYTPEPIPCIDVYNSVYNACWEECLKWCAGIACLYCSEDCSREAKRDAAICCLQRYGSGKEYEQCMGYYTSMSSDDRIQCVEKVIPEDGSAISTDQIIYILFVEDCDIDDETLILGGSMVEHGTYGIKWHTWDPWNYGIRNNALEIYPFPGWMLGEGKLTVQASSILGITFEVSLEYTIVEK